MLLLVHQYFFLQPLRWELFREIFTEVFQLSTEFPKFFWIYSNSGKDGGEGGGGWWWSGWNWEEGREEVSGGGRI